MSTDHAAERGGNRTEGPVLVDDQAAFEDLVNDDGVVLVDFYAEWCGPCQMLEPVVESVAVGTDARVGRVNVDTNQHLAEAYGVRGVPTLLLFAEGEPVERLVGLQNEDHLRSLIEQYGQ